MAYHNRHSAAENYLPSEEMQIQGQASQTEDSTLAAQSASPTEYSVQPPPASPPTTPEHQIILSLDGDDADDEMSLTPGSGPRVRLAVARDRWTDPERASDLLFDSNMDLELNEHLSKDAGLQLLFYDCTPEFGKPGEGLEVTRNHMNLGAFQGLFENYKEATNRGELIHGFDGVFVLFFFVALAMQAGATLDPIHIKLLKDFLAILKDEPTGPPRSISTSDSTAFRGIVRQQFEDALTNYPNDGTPYIMKESVCAEPNCTKLGTKATVCKNCPKDMFYCSDVCMWKHWPVLPKHGKKGGVAHDEGVGL